MLSLFGSHQYAHVQSYPRLLLDLLRNVFMSLHFAKAAADVLTRAAFDPIAKIPGLKVRAVGTEPTAEAAK